jgi:hypothetical protein
MRGPIRKQKDQCYVISKSLGRGKKRLYAQRMKKGGMGTCQGVGSGGEKDVCAEHEYTKERR